MTKPQLLSTIVYQEMNKKQTQKEANMFLAVVYVNFRFDLC